jgi:acetyl-CoA C-acetyltransferase
MSDAIVIVSAARTPIGGLLGDFAGLAGWELGAVAIKAAVERAGVPGDAVDEVLMGNCLMAGQGQAPARQAMRKAGLPDSAGAVTLSKMCGSGMRAMMFGHDMLAAGSAEVVVAGGMESMTNAPHLMFARKGIKYGASAVFDHMAIDGLEDAYERGKAMGVFAEQCVAKYAFSREAMDQFAITSTQRAKAANESGAFDWEIVPVTLSSAKGDTVVKFDEQPFKAKLDKIPTLKPAFKKDGAITAATSSSISDGAAALVLMRESTAKARGLTPIARIVSHSVHAQAPDWFTTAPVGAIQKALAKAGWQASQVDLWEVNEAFAAVTMAAMAEFKLPHDIVNVNGGAVALGHPIGASGARIVVTLLGALKARGLKRGRRADLMLGTHDLALFAATVFVLNATPGVDMAYAVASTLRGGWRQGVAAAVGIMAGCVLHTLAAAFGLAALLATSAEAFAVVKYVGAAYLLYVAWGMARAGLQPTAAAVDVSAPQSLWRTARQGFFTNALNPKVALFFLALLPQFIAADAPSKTLSFLFLGAWFIVQGLLFMLALIALVVPLRRTKPRPWVGRGLNLGGAGLFTALAAKLALTKP